MHTIDIVGVGLTEDTLTRGAMRLMDGSRKIVLHTGRIGAADWLNECGTPFATLDELYEQTDDFDEHAEAAAEAILDIAENEDVVYGVIDVRDESVLQLMQQAGQQVRVHPGVPVDGAMGAFYTGGTYQVCASDCENFQLRADQAALVREIDSAQLASEVKLKLMDVYPDEAQVWVLCDGKLSQIELMDLDRIGGYDHRFCLLVPPCEKLTDQQRYGFTDLLRIVRILQGRGGCPWDRQQTHQSFKPMLIEEAYEVADAVDHDDPFELADELGDVLFEVASHAEIGRRTGEFDIIDVTTAICRKMIHRHPAIFGTGGANAADVWNQMKLEEKQLASYTELLRDISRSLPATSRAVKVQHRFVKFGLPQRSEDEWLQELDSAVKALKAPDIDPAYALGEALTALCGLADVRNTDAELALNDASARRIDRFGCAEQGVKWDDLTAEEKQARWENAAKN